MQIRLYSASSEINGLYLIVDSQQIQINYNIQYNSKVDSSPKNVNYIIELLTLMLFQTHKTFVHLATQSKIFLLPCSVVKSTKPWYHLVLKLKKLPFPANHCVHALNNFDCDWLQWSLLHALHRALTQKHTGAFESHVYQWICHCQRILSISADRQNSWVK